MNLLLLLFCIPYVFLLFQMLVLLALLILINIAMNSNYEISKRWIRASLILTWLCPLLWLDRDFKKHYIVLKQELKQS